MARIKPKALLIQSKMKKGPSRISTSTVVMFTLVVVLFVLSLHATYRYLHRRSSSQTMDSSSQIGKVQESGESESIYSPSYAILDTPKGSITIKLYKDEAPYVVNRFADMCKSGYFKGMLFQHVIKNYIIHGGDSDNRGGATEWYLKAKAGGEVSVSPKHEAFMIGTTKTENPHSKQFDIFITTAPIPDLNENLIVFGRVIKGDDVVQAIEAVDTDEHYRPKSPVGIINITLKQDV